MPQVFISHATSDRDFVEREIIALLERNGVETWYSRDQIKTTEEWHTRIVEALKACDWFLVALSARAIESRWVKAEVDWGVKHRHDRVIPVLIESCEPGECHLQLRLLQHVDYTADLDQARRRLLAVFESAGSTVHDSPLEATLLDDETASQKLRRIRDARDAAGLPLVFKCLLHSEADVRTRALQAMHAIGWAAVSDECERIARGGDPVVIDNVLDGLAAIEAHPDSVALLDRLVNVLTGDLRNRTILLVERKRLSLELDTMARLFRERKAPIEIRRVLGQGLFAATFLAEHVLTRQQVVVRVLRRELRADPRIRARFLDLANRSVRYVHENLALVRDVGQFPEHDLYYCLRDYVDGVTLQDALDAGMTFAPDQIVQLVRAVVTALRPVHERGEAHGGIKPSNVFVCRGSRYMLGDPSLPVVPWSPAMDRLAYDYRYAAPETLYRGDSLPASDFYSAGCVLYQLACGRPPFVSDNPLELAALHHQGSPDRPSAWGSRFGSGGDPAILSLLRREPHERPASVDHVLSALNELARLAGTSLQPAAAGDAAHGTMLIDRVAPQYSICKFDDPGDVFQTRRAAAPATALPPAEPIASDERQSIEPVTVDFGPDGFPTRPPAHPAPPDVLARKDTTGPPPPLESAATTADATLDVSGSWDADSPASLRTLPPGAPPGRIGRFEIQSTLGQGGFGTVYRAYDPQLDRLVALKVVHVRHLDSERMLERFLREARAAARLNHPHLVPVYDTGVDKDCYYIASRYVEGRTLQDVVAGAGLDVRRAAELVRTLAEALHFAHQQGIVHRDVKSANIMLDAAGEPHVMDFGLAHLA
ncbi:MAG TPA: protein kinase, partial [Planctomycetaceae bacterium]|nr:protein kinase [Planctomycetaceae bacterium]